MFNWSTGWALMAATPTHGVFHSEGQQAYYDPLMLTVRMDRTLPYTQPWKFFCSASFSSENATRFFLPSCEKPSASSSETTKTFLVSPHIHTRILLHYSWHEEWKRAMVRYPHVFFCWLRNWRRTSSSSRQHNHIMLESSCVARTKNLQGRP